MCLDKYSACVQFVWTRWLVGNKDGCVSSIRVPQQTQEYVIHHFLVLKIYFRNFHQPPYKPTFEEDAWNLKYMLLVLIDWTHLFCILHITVSHKMKVLFFSLICDSLS